MRVARRGRMRYECGMKTIATLALLLLAPSCFISRDTNNEPLSRQRMETFEPGKSTAADVANVLGAPNEVVQLGKRMAWRYDFTNAKTAGFSIIILTFINSDARADRAWFFFDENSVLQYAGRTLQAEGSEYLMPWWDAEYKD
jgi:hypothetical protein